MTDRPHRPLLLAGLALLLLPPGADAGTVPSPAPVEAARRIAAETAADLPGLSVSVARGGEIVWAEGFGWEDLESRAPATAGTRYAVYSAAKAWTAAAGLRLVAEGMLEIGEPIRTYLPGLPEPLAGATPYQLATHTAGVRHYGEGEAAPDARHCATPAEAVEIFVDDPLLFEPGAGRSYSSWGYVLLSRVIEAAAGEPFPELLERRIFTPAGMADTLFADPAAVIPHRAEPYERAEGGGWARVVGLDITCKWGAGGFLSTAPDLVRFYLAVLGGELVDPASARMLLQPEEDGSFRFGGFSHGGRSAIAGDAETGVVVALATNARGEGIDLADAAVRIRELFETGSAEIP